LFIVLIYLGVNENDYNPKIQAVAILSKDGSAENVNKCVFHKLIIQ